MRNLTGNGIRVMHGQFDAIAGGGCLDILKFPGLRIAGGNNPFATFPVVDLVALAVIIKALTAFHTQPGLQ